MTTQQELANVRLLLPKIAASIAENAILGVAANTAMEKQVRELNF